MSWTTNRMYLKDYQTKARRIDPNKFTLGTVREVSSNINQLNRLLIQFWLLQSFLSLFSDPFSLGSLLSFILCLFFHIYPTRGQLMAYADPCPISFLQKSLGVVVRLKEYCLEIIFSSARELAIEHSMRW